VNCLTADGCSDSFLVEIVDANFGDFVTVEYSIKESGRSLKYFKNVYHVQDVFISSTLEAWKDVDDDTVDSWLRLYCYDYLFCYCWFCCC